MPLSDILILAVIQGIAEFLPISSSGHLVLASTLIGERSASADVNIVLHAGTLLSIVVFYARQLAALADRDRAAIPLIVVGTVPAVVVGLIIKSRFESILENAWLAAAMLLVTGSLLLVSRKLPDGETSLVDLGYARALGIGLAQAFALLPGISRSGSTIVAGLMAGASRETAATFSFLLAIPAIGGASLLEIVDLARGAEASASIGVLAVGAAVSFAVGLLSLSWLIRWLRSGKLHLFAAWCFLVGIVGLAALAWS